MNQGSESDWKQGLTAGLWGIQGVHCLYIVFFILLKNVLVMFM